MHPNRSTPLRGSVTQNNVSVRMRDKKTGVRFMTRLGLLIAALLILSGLSAWLWHVGWPQRQIATLESIGLSLSQKANFSVRDIVVDGRHQSGKDEISDALGLRQGSAILGFNAHLAATRLAKLPWIKSAVIERRLPDTVAVLLTERTPLARWQHDDHTAVIDDSGQILSAARPDDFAQLPLVVGQGADQQARDMLQRLGQFPDIRDQTDSLVRVGDRRWDLHLKPKITVRLPENDVDNALHRLSVLISEEKILDRAITTVDLRLPDRLYIEPGASTTPLWNKKL